MKLTVVRVRVAALILCLFIAPIAADAEEVGEVYRIGVLLIGSREPQGLFARKPSVMSATFGLANKVSELTTLRTAAQAGVRISGQLSRGDRFGFEGQLLEESGRLARRSSAVFSV